MKIRKASNSSSAYIGRGRSACRSPAPLGGSISGRSKRPSRGRLGAPAREPREGRWKADARAAFPPPGGPRGPPQGRENPALPGPTPSKAPEAFDSRGTTLHLPHPPHPLGGSCARSRSHGSPCGLDLPPSAGGLGLPGPACPLAPPKIVFRCAQNSSGPRRFLLRIREERPSVAPPRALTRARAKPRTTLAGSGGGGCRRSSLAPSRRRPPGAKAGPAPAAPPLALKGLASVEAARRCRGRCLRRIRLGGA